MPDQEIGQWQFALVGDKDNKTLAVLPPLALSHHNYTRRENVLDPAKIALIINKYHEMLIDAECKHIEK